MFKIVNNVDGDERELTDIEKALLSRALNTELNAITKLIELSNKQGDAAHTFMDQYNIVVGLYRTVYDVPETLAQYLRRT